MPSLRSLERDIASWSRGRSTLITPDQKGTLRKTYQVSSVLITTTFYRNCEDTWLYYSSDYIVIVTYLELLEPCEYKVF